MEKLKEQYIVDSAFLKEPWKELTYLEIKRITGKNSKSFVYGSLKRLVKDRVILSKKVGRSILYTLNISSTYVQNYAGFLSEHKAFSELPANILQIIENIRNKIPTKFFSLLIMGSYAKKTQTKTSDLDMCLIVDDDTIPKRVLAEISLEAELSIPQIHPFAFTKKEFLQMLSDDGENYGKETVRHNFVFYGGSQYYAILNEAIKHGFRG
jgi:predicted nucleotidyltransferase